MLTLLNQSWWDFNLFLAQAEPGSAEFSSEDAAAAGGAMLLYFVFLIAIYVYFAFTLQKICKKLEVENAWLAWIPIGNYYLMFKAGSEENAVLWTVLALVPFVNIVAFIMLVKAWINIANKLGKSPWLLLLWLVPIIGMIVVQGLFAFA